MADPLSVAGAAVSLLSLAISACQGLTSYIRDWKSYDSEVATTLKQLENIAETLNKLKAVAPSSSSQTSEIVARHLESCLGGLEDLTQFWRRHCVVDPATSFTTLRIQTKRLRFPFHRSAWKELKLTLNTLQISLGVSLHGWQLEKLHALEIDVKFLVEHAIAQRRATKNQVITRVDDGQDDQADTVKLLRQMGLTRSTGEEANQAPKCTCNRFTGTQGYWSGYQKGSLVAMKSSHPCPLHPFRLRETTIFIDVPFLSRVLCYSFQVYLSIKIFPMGFSFTPGLRAIRQVPNGAPIFQRIRSLAARPPRERSKLDAIEELENFRQDVYKLFSTGEATPSDVDGNGHTILWLFLSAYFESCKVRRASELIRFGEILIEFVDCGVPINYTNDCSRTFLDDYIKAVPDQLRFYPPGNVEHLAYRRILGDLVDKGAMATAPSQYERRLDAPTYKCLGQFEQVAEVWKIGPLSQAVLARQELAVLRLLTSRGDYLKERDWRGRTPCHLASDWPRGLRLLLEFNCDADMPDYEGDTPILCASKGGHHEVVQMLLDHGVTFPSASGCKEQVEWGTILFCSLQWPFFTMLLDALKDRRRELLRLATSHPQAQPPSTVGVCPGYLPDAQAASICNLLTRNGITIPNALRIPSDWATIYHYLSPYCEEAKLDYIYNTGFKDIDVPDDKDHTPIERLAGWQMGLGPPLFLWLIKKRVELDRVTNWCNDLRWKSSSYPLLNLIGWSMAEWLSDGVMALLGKPEQLHISHYTPELPYGPHLSDWWMEIATKENKAVIQAGRRMGDLLKLVLTSERRDDCVCLCFLGGCTPAFMVLKRLYDPDFDFNSSAGSHSNHWKGIWSVNGEEGLNDLQSDLVDHLCERRPREVVRTISLFLAGNPAQVQWALSVIRFETFAKLQLRHTCCWFKTHWLNWIVNPEDVTDAHEEDEESIAVLENLVKEFEEKFLELQDDEYDVVDFLNGYWAVRMDQVLTENPVDPDAVRKMKEIGVVLDKDPVERTEQPRSTRDSWPRYRFWERPGTPY